MAKGSRGKSQGLDPSGEAEGVPDGGEQGPLHDPVQVGTGLCRGRGFKYPLSYIPQWKREWIDRVRKIRDGSPDRFECSAARLSGQLSLVQLHLTRKGQFDDAMHELADAARQLEMLTDEIKRVAFELSDVRSRWIEPNKEEPRE